MTVHQQVVFKSIASSASSESPVSGLLVQGKRLGAHALHKGRAGVKASGHLPQSSGHLHVAQSSSHVPQYTLFRKPKPPHKNACGNGAGPDKAGKAGKTMRVDPESLQPHAAPSHTTTLAVEVLEVSSDGAHQLMEEEEEAAFVKAAVIECLNTHYVTPRWDQIAVTPCHHIAVTPCHHISHATHDISHATYLASASSLTSFSNTNFSNTSLSNKSNHPLSKENIQEISSFNPTNLPHRCHPLYPHPAGYRTGEDRLCDAS